MTSEENLNMQRQQSGSAGGGGKMWQKNKRSGADIKNILSRFGGDNQSRDHRRGRKYKINVANKREVYKKNGRK